MQCWSIYSEELSGKDAAFGAPLENPFRTCWYPTGDSLPGTAPVQPQSILGGIIRDIIAASSALPCPRSSFTTMFKDDLLPTLITRKGESNFNCNYSQGGGNKGKKKPHHEDTAFKMPCNSHDMLHPPHPYGGKLTLWQIYEDV